jgi:hypothetical protein
MPDKFVEKICDERHSAIEDKWKANSEEHGKLHGRMTAFIVTVLFLALGALGTLAMFILGKVFK